MAVSRGVAGGRHFMKLQRNPSTLAAFGATWVGFFGFFFADRRGETFGVCNADPQQGVVPETDDPGDLVHERNGQTLSMVRAEGDPVVGEAEPQADRGVPAVRARNESVVDVIERGLYAESPEGRDEIAIVGDIDTVIVPHAQCEKQWGPSLVEPVREVLCCHEFRFWCGRMGLPAREAAIVGHLRWKSFQKPSSGIAKEVFSPAEEK